MFFLRILSLLLLTGHIALPSALASAPHTGGTLHGERRNHDGSRDNRGTDMSHVFRGGDGNDRRGAHDEANARINMNNNLGNDPNYSLNPVLKKQVASLTEGVDQLEKLVEKRNKVRDEIVGTEHQEARQELVVFATDSLRVARDYYRNDEFEEGQIAATIADVALDLATGFTPGVSWGRDIYEAISGKSLINGEELDTFARSTAVLGAVTVGFGSKLGKALGVLGRLMKGSGAQAAILRSSSIVRASAGIRQRMSNVGAAYAGTSIPKYFNIQISGQAFHVNPNGTKHMAEYINHLPPSHSLPLRNDLTLASFEAAVSDAVGSGAWRTSLESQTVIRAGGWELGFAQRATDQYPVVKHALMK